MAEHLFSGSYHEVRDNAIRQALDRVRSLTGRELLSPGLAGELDRIAANYRFNVATLRGDQRSGKRRVERRRKSDYGHTIEVEVPFIDVTIPYVGDPNSFEVAPSHSNIIEYRVVVQPGALLITFPDDQNLDRDVNDFLHRVGENLDRLREESENLQAQVRSQIGAFADTRVTEAKAQNERDKGRSFPIS